MDRYDKSLARAEELTRRFPPTERDFREIAELREIMRQLQREDRFSLAG
jgi:hypothetical protein